MENIVAVACISLGCGGMIGFLIYKGRQRKKAAEVKRREMKVSHRKK